jgi:hypothetical protein
LNMLSSFDIVLIIKGFSDFNHDFSLPFLYDKIWKNKLTNMLANDKLAFENF